MIKPLISLAAALAFAVPAIAQEEPDPAPSPNQIVDAATANEWIAIPAEDLLVMTLAPDAEGNPREVVIQLMPPPFSQGWVDNVKLLSRSQYYDGLSVIRVQDNYVTQWGDPAEGEDAKTPPDGLKVMGEDEYSVDARTLDWPILVSDYLRDHAFYLTEDAHGPLTLSDRVMRNGLVDRYAPYSFHWNGWQIASSFSEDLEDESGRSWPTHCYGMVGVGRNYSPDTGSGAELYTVIGHAPRHLDRNIALVGRVIEGMEHLSSLPRGKGVLGFYGEDELDKRTPILTVRVASDLTETEQPQFEYLSTEGETFAKYAEARANRRDPFFIQPAAGADICNIPVPIRRVSAE